MTFEELLNQREQTGKAEGREEGKVAGREEGKVEGKAESVIELLEIFGAVPNEIRTQILAEKDMEVLKRWMRPGMITSVPKVGNKENIHNSSRYVEDGSYLRLKNITLSYTLPSRWVKKLQMSKVQPYVTAQNLLTFTSYSGYDPEVNAYGNDAVALGIDYGTYPQSKSVIFGINIEF